MDILQEGSMKGVGTGHPHMVKRQADKKTGLVEQTHLASSKDKNKSLRPLEEGACNS